VSLAALRFMAQNDLYGATLTDEDLLMVERYASHHSGGLYVLIRYSLDGRCVKSHESWGDGDEDGNIHIVHNYDPENASDPLERIDFYPSGHAAIAAFLRDEEDDE
jgi:hypothetical protein